MRGGSTSRAGRSRSIPPRARSMRPGRRHPPMWSKVRHRRKTRPRLFTSGPAPDNQPASTFFHRGAANEKPPARQDRVRAGGFRSRRPGPIDQPVGSTAAGVSSIPWGKDRGSRLRAALRLRGRRMDGSEGEVLFPGVPADLDGVPLGDLLLQERGGQPVGQPLLDDPLERPGAVGRVESLLGQPLLGLVGDAERQPGLGELRLEPADLDLDDLGQLRPCPAGGR